MKKFTIDRKYIAENGVPAHCKDQLDWRFLQEDWRSAFWNVTRDYFSPITAVTKNFIEHIEPERRKRAG